MRITTWNIRGGGGKRSDTIAERLREARPDVCVLTEYRTRPGEYLKGALGLRSCAETCPPPNQNGILCYSTNEIAAWDCPEEAIPMSRHRWLTLRTHGIDVLGIHIPNERERWNKTEFWSHVGSFALRHLSTKALIAGDFNTGTVADTEGVQFAHDAQFRALSELGWVDAWRAVHGDRREYTWYSPNRGNGFRLDHCFLSPALAPSLTGAFFDHTVRVEGLSDHSMLTIELAIPLG